MTEDKDKTEAEVIHVKFTSSERIVFTNEGAVSAPFPPEPDGSKSPFVVLEEHDAKTIVEDKFNNSWEKGDAFLEEYRKLCLKYGMTLDARDDYSKLMLRWIESFADDGKTFEAWFKELKEIA